MLRLPRTATAPFCPSEVRGSILVSAATPLWQRMLRMAGPGLLVSVAANMWLMGRLLRG
jgi:manganese transport protein